MTGKVDHLGMNSTSSTIQKRESKGFKSPFFSVKNETNDLAPKNFMEPETPHIIKTLMVVNGLKTLVTLDNKSLEFFHPNYFWKSKKKYKINVKNIVSVTRLCEEKESDVKPEIYKGSGAILDRTSSSSAFTPRKIEKTFSIKREHSAPSIETFCRESAVDLAPSKDLRKELRALSLDDPYNFEERFANKNMRIIREERTAESTALPQLHFQPYFASQSNDFTEVRFKFCCCEGNLQPKNTKALKGKEGGLELIDERSKNKSPLNLSVNNIFVTKPLKKVFSIMNQESGL
ncbi:uncharacterized protein LOC135143563 isoform X2 [Zophobas morio]|uniref:uncharacterized protein LOC135143563 isoform X2 n=1 Tax=Zophobas morio TaxID=2755281 RepID=UPI003083DB70